MKSSLHLIIIIVWFIVAGCNSQPSSGKASKTGSNDFNELFITGVVDDIQQGKDGYTAKITTLDDYVYYATVSRSNLKDARQYKTVRAGDTLIIKGDMWKMKNEDHVTVREMR